MVIVDVCCLFSVGIYISDLIVYNIDVVFSVLFVCLFRTNMNPGHGASLSSLTLYLSSVPRHPSPVNKTTCIIATRHSQFVNSDNKSI